MRISDWSSDVCSSDLIRILVADRPALRTLARVVERIAVAGVAECGRAHAHADARLVHHVKHAGQPVIRLADQFADRRVAFAEVQRRIDRSAITHLVIAAGDVHAVAPPHLAVVVDAVLRPDEPRDTLIPGWRATPAPTPH